MNKLKKIFSRFLSSSAPSGAFEEQFSREILLGEKYRALILSAISGALVIYVMILYIFFSGYFFTDYNIQPPFIWALAILILLAVRSFIISKKLNYIYENHKKYFIFFRYINSFIEVSVPTIAIIVFGQELDKPSALITPPVMLYSVFIILSILELDYKLCLFAGFIAASEYALLSIYFLNQSSNVNMSIILASPIIYIGKSMIIFLSGGVAGLISLQIKKRIYTSYKTVDEKNRLEKLFGQQVSPEIVDEIMRTKWEITSKRRNVSVMFLDIRNFTTFSEKKSPEEIVRYQNDVFSFMIEIVNRNHGIINQLLGDGFMATFGAPIEHGNDCQNAVNTAFEIVKSLEEKKLKKELTGTEVGIGIHTGEVVTGNVGTSIRKQYSITGNTVILASRLEQLNKEYNSSILISKEVLEKIELNGNKPFHLGSVLVKGRAEPVDVYKLI